MRTSLIVKWKSSDNRGKCPFRIFLIEVKDPGSCFTMLILVQCEMVARGLSATEVPVLVGGWLRGAEGLNNSSGDGGDQHGQCQLSELKF